MYLVMHADNKETLERVHVQSEFCNIPLRKGVWEVCVVLPAVGDAAIAEGLAGCSGT